MTKNPVCNTMDVYKLAYDKIVENVLMAQKVEIWEVTKDRKIFSIIKVDLEGNLKKVRSPRYLRHLDPTQLKLFYDYLDNNQSHLDLNEGRSRRQTDFVSGGTELEKSNRVERVDEESLFIEDSISSSTMDRPSTSSVTFKDPKQSQPIEDPRKLVKIGSAPSVLSHESSRLPTKRKTLKQMQDDYKNCNFEDSRKDVNSPEKGGLNGVDDDLFTAKHALPMQVSGGERVECLAWIVLRRFDIVSSYFARTPKIDTSPHHP